MQLMKLAGLGGENTSLYIYFIPLESHGYTSRANGRGALPCIVRLDSGQDSRDIGKRYEELNII